MSGNPSEARHLMRFSKPHPDNTAKATNFSVLKFQQHAPSSKNSATQSLSATLSNFPPPNGTKFVLPDFFCSSRFTIQPQNAPIPKQKTSSTTTYPFFSVETTGISSTSSPRKFLDTACFTTPKKDKYYTAWPTWTDTYGINALPSFRAGLSFATTNTTMPLAYPNAC